MGSVPKARITLDRSLVSLDLLQIIWGEVGSFREQVKELEKFALSMALRATHFFCYLPGNLEKMRLYQHFFFFSSIAKYIAIRRFTCSHLLSAPLLCWRDSSCGHLWGTRLGECSKWKIALQLFFSQIDLLMWQRDQSGRSSCLSLW